MHREGEEVHVSTNEARSGRKGSFVLQILVISLLVILAIFGGLYLFGSQTAPDQGGPVTTVSPT